MDLQEAKSRIPQGRIGIIYREKDMPADTGFFMWANTEDEQGAINCVNIQNRKYEGKRVFYLVDTDKNVHIVLEGKLAQLFEGDDSEDGTD